MMTRAIESLQHRAGGVATACVRGRIAREARRDYEGDEVRIGTSKRVAVSIRGANPSLGTPESVVILRIEYCREAIADGHVDECERTSVLGERATLLRGDLCRCRVEDGDWRGRCIESSDIGTILRSVG